MTFGINYIHYDTIMTLLLHLSLLQKSDYYYTLWQNPGKHYYYTYDSSIIAITLARHKDLTPPTPPMWTSRVRTPRVFARVSDILDSRRPYAPHHWTFKFATKSSAKCRGATWIKGSTNTAFYPRTLSTCHVMTFRIYFNTSSYGYYYYTIISIITFRTIITLITLRYYYFPLWQMRNIMCIMPIISIVIK